MTSFGGCWPMSSPTTISGTSQRHKRWGLDWASGSSFSTRSFPGSGRITPLAGALVTSGYSRTEEYAADRHGVDILVRAGYSKNVMVNTLTWLLQTEGASGGGMLASHPGMQERIDALKKP